MHLTTNLMIDIIILIRLLIDSGLSTVLNKVQASTITIFRGRFFSCNSLTDTFLFDDIIDSSSHSLNNLPP